MTEPDATGEDIATTVRAALAAAGLSPTEEELAGLVAGYPAFRARIDALYAIPETRYASPALVFDPAPVFTDWSD